MGILWLWAAVWAHKTGRDPSGYGLAAAFFCLFDAVAFWAWMTNGVTQ